MELLKEHYLRFRQWDFNKPHCFRIDFCQICLHYYALVLLSRSPAISASLFPFPRSLRVSLAFCLVTVHLYCSPPFLHQSSDSNSFKVKSRLRFQAVIYIEFNSISIIHLFEEMLQWYATIRCYSLDFIIFED